MQQVGEETVYRTIRSATPSTWFLWLFTLGLWEIWRRQQQYVVTTRRVIVRRGLVYRRERIVPIDRLQDVTTRTGIMAGYVVLSSAGGSLGVERMGPVWNGTVRAIAAAIQQQMENSRGFAGAGLGGLPTVAPRPALHATPAQPPAFTLSPDGVYWWSGTAWIESAVAAPPGALQSPDGKAWHDGQAWHALRPAGDAPTQSGSGFLA